MTLQGRGFTYGPPRKTHEGTRHDLAASADWYGKQLGWPVTFDLVHRRLVLRTGEMIDAVVMPDWLASQVATDLELSLLAGPICIDATETWWTFLIQPGQKKGTDVPPELRRCRVHVIPSGGQCIVPCHQDTHRWRVVPKLSGALPPWTAVMGTARRALSYLKP